jgi:anti-sigma B factor antagonist
MDINKTVDGSTLTFAVSGRMDTSTTPLAQAELDGSLEGINELVFDFRNLDYISSVGLRLLLSAQKQMNKQGKMKIINVNEDIMDIFDDVGFTGIMNIEEQ